MLAARYYGKEDIRTEELAKPVPKENEALIKIIYGGICGSDLHIYREGMFMTYAPETLGHEFVGRIESAPTGSGFNQGDIVTGNPAVECGQCEYCLKGDYLHCPNIGFIGEVRPGCFAEYMVMDTNKLIKFKQDVNLLEAGVVEPVTVALHSSKRINCGPNDKIAVFGCGPIGLLIAYFLKHIYHAGWVTMIDTDPYRRSQALQCGADEVISSYYEGKYETYSMVLDNTGAEKVLNQALEIVEPNGILFVTALYEKSPVIDVNLLVVKEAAIIGNSAYTFDELKEAVELINSGKYSFSWIVTNIVPINNAAEAFKSLASKDKSDLKIFLDLT